MATDQDSEAVIFVDADNTLWDTDELFARAQLSLLRNVEEAVGRIVVENDRLAFVRSIDQSIAERHHLRLRYPTKLLAMALAKVVCGETVSRAVREAWMEPAADDRLTSEEALQISMKFESFLRAIPLLRSGVESGLDDLRSMGCSILVLTEGRRDRALHIAEYYGIRKLFDRVIESPKTPTLYSRVLRLYKHPRVAVMVGDQLDRDIAPALEAGLRTVYYPSGFNPRWQQDQTAVKPDFRITSFSEVAPIVAAMLHRACGRENTD